MVHLVPSSSSSFQTMNVTTNSTSMNHETEQREGDEDSRINTSPSKLNHHHHNDDDGDAGQEDLNSKDFDVTTTMTTNTNAQMMDQGLPSSRTTTSPPSPPPPPPPPLSTTTHVQLVHQQQLEDRVQELEQKLATLSLILSQQQQQQRRSQSVSPPSITPLASPKDWASIDGSRYLPLDSPVYDRHPRSIKHHDGHRRNLSYQVLHCDSPYYYTYGRQQQQQSHDPNTPRGHHELMMMEDSTTMASPTPIFLPMPLFGLTESDSMSQSPQRVVSSSSIRPLGTDSQGNGTTPQDSDRLALPDLEKNPNKNGSILNKDDPVRVSSSTPSAGGIPLPTSTTKPNLEQDATPQGASVPAEKVDKVKSKWLDYLNSFQESNYDTDKQMEEFVKIPSAVEALLSFGFWICVDSFLYILTILPIRFVWSFLLLARFVTMRFFFREIPDGPFRFHRRHSYQLIQVGIIYTIYEYVLLPISIGKFYHWIRGQAMVKLYVLIAMVEVFDRLMSSLGQDCLDSLYWNTTRRPRSSRLIVSVSVVLFYTAVHSCLLFAHIATLNVAMNSDDQALISLLIGGNFAEIKSTVFKKYNKANLFKITASDICERFKLALFLALVLMLNMSQGMDEKMVMNYIHMCGIVWCAEWLADWIKHSFITKFNYISSHIYPEYGLLLAGDVTGIGHEGVNLDHSHAVVKRIGFAQLPLVCVMARYTKEAFKYATYQSQPSYWMVGFGFFGVWLVLLICKLSLGSFLQRISLAKLRAAPEFSSQQAKILAKKNN